MNAQATGFSAPTFEYEVDLENYFYQHFDDVMGSAGLDLLLVERQPSLPGSRLDLLALDRDALPWIIELKAGTAAPQVISQALKYTDAVDRMQRDDFLALPGLTDAPTLDKRFKQRFGRDFTFDPGRIPGVILIGKEFDASAQQMITTLQRYNAPMLAFRYVVGYASTEVRLEKLDPIDCAEESLPRSILGASRSPGATVNAQLQGAVSRAYRVPVSDDVKKFWEWFTATYTQPVVPVDLIIQKHVVWQARTATKALRPPSGNIGILCRQIKKLALENDEWVRVFFRPDSLTDKAANPARILKAKTTHGAPYTKVAYVRKAELAQHFNLVG